MKKLSLKLSILVLFVFAVMVGCGGGSNPMVGTWKMQVDESMTKGLAAADMPTMTMEFKADNTWEGKMKVNGKEQTAGGTYTIKDKHVVMKQTMEDGKPKTGKDEEFDLAEDMKSFPLPGSDGKGKVVKQ